MIPTACQRAVLEASDRRAECVVVGECSLGRVRVQRAQVPERVARARSGPIHGGRAISSGQPDLVRARVGPRNLPPREAATAQSLPCHGRPVASSLRAAGPTSSVADGAAASRDSSCGSAELWEGVEFGQCGLCLVNPASGKSLLLPQDRDAAAKSAIAAITVCGAWSPVARDS